MREHQTGSHYRVVPSPDRDNERQFRLAQDGELPGEPRHVIRRNQPIPRPLIGVQSEKNLPVIDRREATVDPRDRNQLDVRAQPILQPIDNRLREVLIKGEQSHSPDTTDELRGEREGWLKLPFEVERVFYVLMLQNRVEPADLRRVEPANAQCGECLGLYAGVMNVGCSSELARQDPQPRSRLHEVGTSVCSEIERPQNVELVSVYEVLTVESSWRARRL